MSPPSRKRRRRKLPGSNEDDEDYLNGSSDDSSNFISAEDAVQLVRDPSVDTLVSPNVEKFVWARIAG